MTRGICLGFLYFIFLSVAPPAFAITYEEFQFQLTEAQKQKQKTEQEIKDLTQRLAGMKEVGTPIDERKQYSEELIETIKYLEELKKKLAELRALYPEVKVTPIYRLVRIDPEGVPGRYGESSHLDAETPFALASVRVIAFPTEIVAGETFTVSGDVIYRERFSEKGHCYEPARDGARLQVSMNAYLSEVEQAAPALSLRYQANGLLSRLCSDAPVDIDPESHEKLQAGYEKDNKVNFSARFVPIRTEKDENGLFTYTYKLEASSSGERIRSIAKALLFSETEHTAARGVCSFAGAPSCGVLRISISGTARGFQPTASLIYRQIADGEQFIERAPSYSHPAALGEAPKIGSIKLATTVPDIKGLTKDQAERALSTAQLRMTLSPEITPPRPQLEGRVQETLPKIGSRVALQSSVSVTLYGRYISTHTVPNLVGLKSEAAKKEVEALGFVAEAVVGNQAPSKEKEFTVTHQTPLSGTALAEGEVVSLKTWGRYIQPALTPDQSCDKDWPGSISSGTRSVNGGWDCVCPQGQQWNAGRTACEQIPQLTPDESCNRDWPGSVSSGNRSANGGWDCICPQGQQWNAGRTACEQIPQLTPDESCNRDWPGSVSSGSRSANGGWDCICPQGQQWNAGRTACEQIPQLTPDESCNRDWPGSVSSGSRSANGGWDCICPQGQQWNQGRTACVNVPRPPNPSPPPRPTACHPWQRASKLTLPFGETTICECLYGSAINSHACLPPRPAGYQGCPPGTKKEYSRPDGLGLGCECMYGSENGVCRTG